MERSNQFPQKKWNVFCEFLAELEDHPRSISRLEKELRQSSINIEEDLIFRTLVMHGNLTLVKYLLNSQSAQPQARHQDAIRTACQYGYLEIVNLLLEYPKVDPSHPICMIMAIKGGYLKVVRRLLQDIRVTYDQRALMWAQDQPAIMKLLM